MIVDRSIPLPKRVHEARRAAKQGRALLKLAPKPARDAARTARAALRELRKSLGPARDARVALTLIEKQAKRNDADAERFAAMLTNLTHACAKAESALTARLLKDAAHRLQIIATSIPDDADAPDALDDIVQRAVSAYREARRLVPAEGAEIEEDALHALRSAIVDHRYQMEMIAALDGRKLARRVKALQKLRNDLGDYLDVRRIETLLAEQPEHNRAATKRIAKAQTRRLDKALAEASRLFDEKPKALRALLIRETS